MYANNAYLNNTTMDIKDKSSPLIVTSCGTYHLFTRPKLPTWRPRGRLDFQLLYIASGKAHFHFNGKEEIVTAGHMVLYRPKEPQKYEYYGEDQTEVYWVHFTGNDVTNILRYYGFTKEKHVYYCGKGLDYQNHFRLMIQELQMCKEHYEAIKKVKGEVVSEDIDVATLYFNEHYNEEINIEEYAQTHNMSTSWFIRNFKQYTGFTPLQYILSVRIYNAEALLKSNMYNITEVASIVGYDNPLYFSRTFKKLKGISPSEYRNSIET